MSIVIAIANQKGGVGKTTTCVNLGAGLARKGFKVLLVDLDPQGSLTHYLKLDGPDITIGSLGDWIMGRAKFDEVQYITPFAEMAVVRSTTALTGDESHIQLNAAEEARRTGDNLAHYKVLGKAVEGIRDRFDYILIDTPPTFSLLFTNSLFACDAVLIPSKMEFLSIRAIGPLIARVKEVSLYRKPIVIIGLVSTLWRVNVKEQVECLADVKGKIGDDLFSTYIRQNTTLAQCATYGRPIQFFDNGSPGAKDYDALTLEVMDRCELQKPAAAR